MGKTQSGGAGFEDGEGGTGAVERGQPHALRKARKQFSPRACGKNTAQATLWL